MNSRWFAVKFWTPSNDIYIALFMLLFSLLTFSLVLIYPPPVQVTSLFFKFHVQTGLLFMVFLSLVFAKKGIVWEMIGLILVIVLFGLPLIYKWQTATFDGMLFGGLLPYSDASGYYAGAQRLMTGNYLSELATHRPLFPSFLAVLLKLTGNNLQISLAILAALNGVSTFLAAREIQKAHTASAAALFTGIGYWYYCRIAGTTMTENLGFSFGCLGLAFLIQGGKGGTLWKIGFGFFLLTTALSIRAGAFFILPALLLWFVIAYKNDFGWKGFLFVSLAIFIAMTSNVIFKWGVGNPKGVLFSNYSYTLYGLASGNAGWSYILTEIPDVHEDEILGLAINKIKREPALFASGMARAFVDYFRMHNGAFSFMRLIYDNDTGNHLLWLLTWMGVATALFDSKSILARMVLLAYMGVFASTALVPPRDADFMRVYAATFPVTAYLASLGALLPGVLLKKLGLYAAPAGEMEWKADHLLLPFSTGLLFACLVLPFVLKAMGQAPQVDGSPVCSANKVPISFLMGPGSSLRLVKPPSVYESYLPAIPVASFRSGSGAGPQAYTFLKRELLNVKPGSAISVGVYRNVPSPDSDSVQTGYLISNGPLLKPGPHQICVIPAQDENLRTMFFYYRNGTGGQHQDLSLVQKNPDQTKAIRTFYALGLVAVLLGIFDFWSIAPARKIFVLGSLVLIIVGVLVNLHSTMIYTVAWQRRVLPATQMIHVEGYSYKINLGIHWADHRSPGGSSAIIYENGIPLKHPNNSLFSIKQRGKGRFSVQDGYVFLSASDNSNPQTNGRMYEIYWPMPIPGFYRYFVYFSAFVGVFFLVRFYYHNVRGRAEPDPKGLYKLQ